MAAILPTPSYDSLIDPSLRDEGGSTYPSHATPNHPDQHASATETSYDELLRQAQSLQQQRSSLDPYSHHHHDQHPHHPSNTHDDSIHLAYPYDETQQQQQHHDGSQPPAEGQPYQQHSTADVEAATAAVMAYHAANPHQEGQGEGGQVGGAGGGGQGVAGPEGREAHRSLGQEMQAFWDALPLDTGLENPLDHSLDPGTIEELRQALNSQSQHPDPNNPFDQLHHSTSDPFGFEANHHQQQQLIGTDYQRKMEELIASGGSFLDVGAAMGVGLGGEVAGGVEGAGGVLTQVTPVVPEKSVGKPKKNHKDIEQRRRDKVNDGISRLAARLNLFYPSFSSPQNLLTSSHPSHANQNPPPLSPDPSNPPDPSSAIANLYPNPADPSTYTGPNYSKTPKTTILLKAGELIDSLRVQVEGEKERWTMERMCMDQVLKDMKVQLEEERGKRKRAEERVRVLEGEVVAKRAKTSTAEAAAPNVTKAAAVVGSAVAVHDGSDAGVGTISSAPVPVPAPTEPVPPTPAPVILAPSPLASTMRPPTPLASIDPVPTAPAPTTTTRTRTTRAGASGTTAASTPAKGGRGGRGAKRAKITQ